MLILICLVVTGCGADQRKPVDDYISNVPSPEFFYADHRSASKDAAILVQQIRLYSDAEIEAAYERALKQSSYGLKTNESLCLLNRLLFEVPTDEVWPLEVVGPRVFRVKAYSNRTPPLFQVDARAEFLKFKRLYPRRE